MISVLTVCESVTYYIGFIVEREENEPLEQLTCAAMWPHHVGHQKGHLPESVISWLAQKYQIESMAL